MLLIIVSKLVVPQAPNASTDRYLAGVKMRRWPLWIAAYAGASLRASDPRSSSSSLLDTKKYRTTHQRHTQCLWWVVLNYQGPSAAYRPISFLHIKTAFTALSIKSGGNLRDDWLMALSC